MMKFIKHINNQLVNINNKLIKLMKCVKVNYIILIQEQKVYYLKNQNYKI